MANPLARVVMKSIAQNSDKIEKRTTSNVTSNPNLGKRETQLLTSLINNKGGSAQNSSYNKSTYGRSKNVSSSSQNMQSLSSLAGGSVKSEEARPTREVKNTNIDLKSLCTLDNVSVGKSNTTKTSNRNVMQKLSLDQLVSGNNKTVKQESKTSYKKQASGMTTLDSLAKSKTKNIQSENSVTNKSDNVTTSTGYVRSSVINNLDAYIPKVTLESIGKKGSLF